MELTTKPILIHFNNPISCAIYYLNYCTRPSQKCSLALLRHHCCFERCVFHTYGRLQRIIHNSDSSSLIFLYSPPNRCFSKLVSNSHRIAFQQNMQNHVPLVRCTLLCCINNDTTSHGCQNGEPISGPSRPFQNTQYNDALCLSLTHQQLLSRCCVVSILILEGSFPVKNTSTNIHKRGINCV